MKRKANALGAHTGGYRVQAKWPKLWACHYLIDTGNRVDVNRVWVASVKAARISRRRRYTQRGMEEVVAHDD